MNPAIEKPVFTAQERASCTFRNSIYPVLGSIGHPQYWHFGRIPHIQLPVFVYKFFGRQLQFSLKDLKECPLGFYNIHRTAHSQSRNPVLGLWLEVSPYRTVPQGFPYNPFLRPAVRFVRSSGPFLFGFSCSFFYRPFQFIIFRLPFLQKLFQMCAGNMAKDRIFFKKKARHPYIRGRQECGVVHSCLSVPMYSGS